MSAILHVRHVLRKLDADAWGGTETHVAAITRALFAEGFSSSIDAPRRGARPAAIDARVDVRRFDAFCPFIASSERRRRLWETGGNIVSLDAPVRLALDRRTALVHLHTAGRIGGAVRVAMRLTGRPYVVSVHGPLAAESALLAEHTRDRLARTIDLGKPFGALFGARRVLDDAARVIVFNEGEKKALEPRLGARVVRIDHGVDLARFDAADAARGRALHPSIGAGPFALVVGRMSTQKNQLHAVRAFAAGAPPEARLVLAGAETDAGYAAATLAEARALGVGDRVSWIGNVAPADVPHLVAASTVLLVPSVHEAFGLVVLEGWAARTPVLFSHTAGLVDVGANLSDRSWALPVGDVATWALALRRVFEAPERRRAAGLEGRAIVERRYTWARAASELAAVYRDALGPSRSETRRAAFVSGWDARTTTRESAAR